MIATKKNTKAGFLKKNQKEKKHVIYQSKRSRNKLKGTLKESTDVLGHKDKSNILQCN
jgi:hypothetical protein